MYITKVYQRDRYAGAYAEQDGQTYEIELRYDLGGMNYFSGRVQPRGYVVSVCPITLENDNGVTIKSFQAFTGKSMIVKEADRFSQKVFNGLLHDPATFQAAAQVFAAFSLPVTVPLGATAQFGV